jgi:hypothetical protein
MSCTDYAHWVRVMVFNATLNNISAISWRSVLLVEKLWFLSVDITWSKVVSSKSTLNSLILLERSDRHMLASSLKRFLCYKISLKILTL